MWGRIFIVRRHPMALKKQQKENCGKEFMLQSAETNL
jgi:hypothetical protein